MSDREPHAVPRARSTRRPPATVPAECEHGVLALVGKVIAYAKARSLYRDYLKYEKDASNDTLELYVWYVDDFVAHLPRWKDWQGATIVDYRNYQKLPSRKPVKGGKVDGGPKKPNTRATARYSLRDFYEWAYRKRYVSSNPLADAPPIKIKKAPPRDLKPEEMARILNELEQEPDKRVEAAVFLEWRAGLRGIEVVRANVEDVYLGAVNPHIRIPLGKGDKPGTVPLAPPVVAVLERYLAGRRYGPIIPSLHDPTLHITRAHLTRGMVKPLFNRAGVDATPHQLRHTFATDLLALGWGLNLRAVKNALRHESWATTEAYTRGYDADTHYWVGQLDGQPGRQPASRPMVGGPMVGGAPLAGGALSGEQITEILGALPREYLAQLLVNVLTGDTTLGPISMDLGKLTTALAG